MVMIKSSSEANNLKKNRYLITTNFSNEIALWFNFLSLHLLDNFIGKILALDATKSYLRKQIKVGRIVIQTLRSAAITTVLKKTQVFQPHSTYPAQNETIGRPAGR